MKSLLQLASLALVVVFLSGFAIGQSSDPKANGSPSDGLVCCYSEESLKGRQLVLSFSGAIKFLEPDKPDASATADIFRHTAASVSYKIVMDGRTDSFVVNLKTLRGTQTLSYPDRPDVRYSLTCIR